jgi:hypothetical protein
MSVVYCGNFDEYDEAGACTTFTGGNNAMILVRKGTSVDPESESSVQAAIDAGNAGILKNIKASINEPAAIRADSTIGCAPQVVLNYNRSATIVDGKVTEQNVEFWNGINSANGFVAGMAIIYSCAHNRQHVVDANIVVLGGYVNPLSDEESQQFNITLEWKSKVDPSIDTVPNPLFAA